MSTPEVVVTRDAGVQVIRIQRPEKKNSLTNAMYTAMAEALLEAANDPAVRAVMFAGSPDIFCSGNDLKDFLSAKGGLKELPVGRFIEVLGHYEKPVVAAVNGAAIGIGTTMLLHCDLVYAGEGARFQLPFTNLGLCPEFASSYILPRLIGHVRAAELLLLGEFFDAQKALSYGLINEVLAPEEVEKKALMQAHRLAKQAPQALRISKQIMRKSYAVGMQQSIDIEMEHFSGLLKGPEMKEAVDAFLQKRQPDFSQFQ